MIEPADDSLFEAEAQRVRRWLEADGRSENLLRLFEYLLARPRDVRAPKEIEIAFEVFGKDARYDTSQDAMVRVYVHRLRGRLDEIYRDVQGPRLVIPKGEYRILLAKDVAAPAETSNRAPDPARQPGRSLVRLAGLAFLVTALGWATLFYLRGRADAETAPAAAAYRNPDARCGMPLLVAGDSYLYSEASPGDTSRRLIMRPTIRSAAQLDEVRAGQPPATEIRDLDDYYMSAGTADGLWSLFGALAVRDRGGKVPPPVLPISKLTPKHLNGGDIFYFGRLDQLAGLHDIVFQASRFTFDPVTDTLRDPGSGRLFTARLTVPAETDGDPAKRPVFANDYGYLARIAKPDGCVVWIVAALQDDSLPQMARIAGTPSELDTLFRQSRDAASFEALYEIRSLGALQYNSRLLFARPIETAR